MKVELSEEQIEVLKSAMFDNLISIPGWKATKKQKVNMIIIVNSILQSLEKGE